MSEEQKLNETNKNGKFTLLLVLTILSLLLSIAAMTLTLLQANGILAGGATTQKVVISKKYDKGRSLDKAIDTKKPMLVFFYTDWCGFCQRFAPTFDKVTKDSKIKKNFAIAYVNCENQENHKYMEEYDVHGFPMVFVVTQDGKKTLLDNNTFFNEDSKEVITEDALELLDDSKEKAEEKE